MTVIPTRGPARPWRLIAEEASREFDPKKMAELMQELNRAMEEQGIANSGTQPAQRKSA